LSPCRQEKLIVQTIQALNEEYRCPYERTIEFPLSNDLPADERAGLEATVRGFSRRGVPDTVAYLSEDEVQAAMTKLESLGYDRQAIRTSLAMSPYPVDYYHFFF
jgi:hypothetical protein